MEPIVNYIEGQYYKALSRLYEQRARTQKMSLRVFLFLKAKKVIQMVHQPQDDFDSLSLKTCFEERLEPSRSEPSRQEPSRQEISRSELSKPELGKPELGNSEHSLVVGSRKIEERSTFRNVNQEEDHIQRLARHTRASLMLEKMIEVIDREVWVLSQGETVEEEQTYTDMTSRSKTTPYRSPYVAATQVRLPALDRRSRFLGTIKDYQ